MKKKSSSQSAFFNVRVLIRLFIILVGIFLALLGLGGFSNVFAQPKISSRDSASLFSVPTFSAQGSSDVSRFSLPTTDGGSALDGFDPNANGPVYVVVVQPDGKILIGGDFTTLSPNGGPPVTRNHIARLNPDGTLDNAFDPNCKIEFCHMQSRCRRTARFWRAALSTEQQHRRTDAQSHRPARSRKRLG